MTVQELMNRLSTYEPTAEVRFADTYTQNEGWLPEHKTATCEIGEIHLDTVEGIVVLEEML